MRKVLLGFLVLISTMNCTPVLGQERTAAENIITEFKEDFTQYIDMNLLSEGMREGIVNYNKTTKYCTGNNVNVRELPGTTNKVLGQLVRNTAIEAIAEYDGWTCITTQDGIAFVYSEYLSDTEMISNNRWNVVLNDNEFEILCRIVMLESGGESDIGQQAVTEVILNRVVNNSFPNDVVSVLGQRSGGYAQFSTWRNVNSNRAIPSDRVKNNVHAVLNGETNILPYKTVYFSRGPQNKRIQTRIGNHVFCNE